MSDARSQVGNAILTMLQNIKSIAEKNPNTTISGGSEQFNSLLRQAKEAFPHVTTITDVKESSSHTSVLDLVIKLSAMHGAIAAEGPEPGSFGRR